MGEAENYGSNYLCTGEEAYEKNSGMIDILCRELDIDSKEPLYGMLYQNESNNSVYDIVFDEHKDYTGRYFFTNDYNSKRYIMKQMTEEEMKSDAFVSNLSDEYLNKNLGEDGHVYKVVYAEKTDSYESEENDNDIEPDIEPSIMKIDDSMSVQYEEEREGTRIISGCWDGYINKNDNFAVSYKKDAADWVTGEFKDGEWHTDSKTLKQLETFDCLYGDDKQFWTCDETSGTLIVFDNKGNTVYRDSMANCLEKNKIKSKENELSGFTVVDHNTALFNTKNSSYMVNLKNNRIVKQYDRNMYGKCYGDYVYIRNDKNVISIVNIKTGKTEKCIDASCVRSPYYPSDQYFMMHSDYTPCNFLEMKGDEELKFNVINDTLYISFFTGVYRYNSKKDVLEQIIKGEDYPNFKELYGNFYVNSKKEVFLLGFIGGVNDEYPYCFLVMKPKKR